MDLIKETYNILLYHLGEDSPRGRKIPQQYDELKKDLTRLVSYGIGLGKVIGYKEASDYIDSSLSLVRSDISDEIRAMQNQVIDRRPESREVKKEDE